MSLEMKIGPELRLYFPNGMTKLTEFKLKSSVQIDVVERLLKKKPL